MLRAVSPFATGADGGRGPDSARGVREMPRFIRFAVEHFLRPSPVSNTSFVTKKAQSTTDTERIRKTSAATVSPL